MINHRYPTVRRAVLAGTATLTVLAGTLAPTAPASAFGQHERYYRGGGAHHNRGLGVGAAVGLGVLGAAAAGAAASQYYNGYPVYPQGSHSGYGYDYYPDHGGYYGPY